MIDHGLDIQQAIEMPRFLSGRFALGEARDTLHIEGRFPPETIDELERRGHTVNRWARLERDGRPRPRHHDRSGDGNSCAGGSDPAQVGIGRSRRLGTGDRVLTPNSNV